MAENRELIKRGYLTIAVRNRGKIGRARRKAHNEASKAGWAKTGRYFHANLRQKRFTPEHAEKAGYTKRRGERVPESSPKFSRLYYGRKLRSPDLGGGLNRADPLVKTGESKRLARSARVSSTSKGAKVTYSALRKFNYRHPRSQVRMSEEFRRFTRAEVPELAQEFDTNYDDAYKNLDR